ncbi:MAG TPA: response regulator [Steroidobacteraceae bacterium]|jgi:CheY-like chemotaxis protein
MMSRKVSPQRVLIVDDNEDAAESMALVLKLEGHETDFVYSAADALMHAASFRPDVVLLDIGLPGMNGYQVAQQMRELPGLKHVRLVAVTGYGRSEDRLRAREAGFDAHLVKPVDYAVLEKALRPNQARGA